MEIRTGNLIADGLPPERMGFICDLIARGGPEPHEYEALTAWIDTLAADVGSGAVTREAVAAMWRDFTRQHFRGTLQGLVVEKPHGYHGDFEFIDGVHSGRISTDPRLARWDSYLQAQAAPKAVRNRKYYLHNLLKLRCGSDGHPVQVLNVACGPARDIREWLDSNGKDAAHFDCVDLDANAIRFAESLCSGYARAVRFFHCNALLFKPPRRYELVWSSGLFDYLDDGLFVRLLRRLLRFAEPNGEVVVGNFHPSNPTRNYRNR